MLHMIAAQAMDGLAGNSPRASFLPPAGLSEPPFIIFIYLRFRSTAAWKQACQACPGTSSIYFLADLVASKANGLMMIIT